MHELSPERIVEFRKMMKDEYGKEYTDQEAQEAAYNLAAFVDVLLESAGDELERKEQLKKEPKGFYMEAGGRNCFLCRRSIYGDEKIWYDKWGFKCKDCKEAADKGVIPNYVFADHDNKRHFTASTLSWKFNIRTQTIRKLVKQGKLKAREISSSGMLVLLKKENPDLSSVIKQTIHESVSL